MKALLLAAGRGTRLKPYTDVLPKCLMPIQGRPVLDFWLQALSIANITEVFVNTHYLHQQVEDYLQYNAYFTLGKNLHICYEKDLLGTAGTLFALADQWQDEALLVAHGDNIFNFELSRFIDNHQDRPSGTLMTMALFRSDTPSNCGIVCLDENNMVVDFLEKVTDPPGNLANAAIYVLQPEVRHNLDCEQPMVDCPYDLSQHVIPYLMHKIFGWEISGNLIDIGFPEAWAKAQKIKLELQQPCSNDWYKNYLNHPIHSHLQNLLSEVER